MLITLEGTDGVGKSALLHGYEDQRHGRAGSSYVYHGGLAQRLRHLHPYVTQEPGSVDFEPLLIDKDLRTVDFFAYVVSRKAKRLAPKPQSRITYLMNRVRLAHLIGASVLSWKPHLYLGEPLRTPRLEAFERKDQAYGQMLTRDDGLKRDLADMTLEDCCRQILMYCTDSADLDPTPSGLVFLAGHLAHIERLNRLPTGTLILSDRYRESQLAFGPARGADPLVASLYRRWSSRAPDLQITLTCETDELERRIEGRGGAKQNGKQWNKRQIRAAAQENYHEMAQSAEHPTVLIDTTGRSRSDVINEAYQIVMDHRA